VSGEWHGRLIDTESGGWSDIVLRLSVERAEGAVPTVSGELVYIYRDQEATGRVKTLSRYALQGTWLEDVNALRIEWGEQASKYSFDCRITGLFEDLLRCEGTRKLSGKEYPYLIKAHRPPGWLGF
jgi:hypothetical protein